MLKTLLVAASLTPFVLIQAATTLPVGPITFGTNADYDTRFKESVFDTGVTRNAAGELTGGFGFINPSNSGNTPRNGQIVARITF